MKKNPLDPHPVSTITKSSIVFVSLTFFPLDEIFFKKNIYLFIWLHQVLVVAQRLQSTQAQYLWLRLSCSTARGIFISQPGIKPLSHASKDGFLTIEP